MLLMLRKAISYPSAELADRPPPTDPYGASREEGPYGLGWNLAPEGSWVRHLGAVGSLGWVDLRVPCAGVFLSGVSWAGDKHLADDLMGQARSSFS